MTELLRTPMTLVLALAVASTGFAQDAPQPPASSQPRPIERADDQPEQPEQSDQPRRPTPTDEDEQPEQPPRRSRSLADEDPRNQSPRSSRSLADEDQPRSQSPARPLPQPTADAPILLNFKDVSVDVVLEYISEVAGLVVIKTLDVQGTVTVISRQPLTVEEAVSVLNSVLKEKGYAAILMDRTLKIVDFVNASKESIPVRAGNIPELIPRTDEMVTQVIQLKHADCSQLANDIAPLLPSYAVLAANVRTNSLILTDTSANIRRITEIVRALDESMVNAVDVRVFPLEFADARDAAQLINELFGDQGRGRGGRGGQQQDPRAQLFMRMARGGGIEAGAEAVSGGTDVRPQASADERTNTVVVTGPPASLDIIAGVIEELDSNPAATQAVYIHKVRNGDAVQMANVLNQLFGSTMRGGGGARNTGRTGNTNRGVGGNTNRGFGNSNNRGFGGGSGGFGGGSGGFGTGGSRGGGFGRSGNAGNRADDLTDTIPVAQQLQLQDMPLEPLPQEGDEEFNLQSAAAGLAGQVDVVAESDTNSLVIMTHPRNFAQIQKIIEELDRPMPQVLIKVLIAEVTHDRSLEVGAEWSIMNDRGSFNLFTDFGVASATGGMIMKLAEKNLEVTLRALEEMGKLDVLSRPYILVAENQSAGIMVGQRVPFIVRSRVTDAGQVINDIQYEDVGIILEVTPHINSEGLVVMDVTPTISAITDSSVRISEVVSAPIFSNRSASSRVAVQDGQTVVIGGLMQDQLSETVRKVPLLGDIPLVGELFKSTKTEKTKTELLIFLTPHVAHDSSELDDLSRREQDGTKIVPQAVAPGMFDEHMEGMRRGMRPERASDVPSQPRIEVRPIPQQQPGSQE